MANVCEHCGTALHPRDRFCAHCGQATGVTSAVPAPVELQEHRERRWFGPPPPGSATWIALAIMLGPVFVAMVYGYEHRGPYVLYASALLLGLIPASIARSKGRNFAQWWVFGTYLWLVALIASLVISPKPILPNAELS